MSFFPIPLDKNYTGQKKLKSPKDEKIPKPKTHTIKDVKENQKISNFEVKDKVKQVIKALNDFRTYFPNEILYTIYDDKFCAFCSVENIFCSSFEAKCFIKSFRQQIVDQYASN